jgi:hypothetical protein
MAQVDVAIGIRQRGGDENLARHEAGIGDRGAVRWTGVRRREGLLSADA